MLILELVEGREQGCRFLVAEGVGLSSEINPETLTVHYRKPSDGRPSSRTILVIINM